MLRGIGLAIAKKAAAEGANVVIAAKTDKPHPKLPGTIHTAAGEIEQAGGKASTGTGRILDIEPTELHQRTPLIMGSPDQVDHVLKHL